jgi:translation initiation factor IF-3
VIEELKDEVSIDQYPKMDGRKMFLVVSPIKKS